MKNNRHILLFSALIMISFLACSLPSFGNKSGNIQLLADALKNRSVEPTPFQPFCATTTSTNNAQPIYNALVPNPGLVPPDGQINILVLGSDWRVNSGYRTDIIMLVSIYTLENKVSLLSFPRDLYVEIPGFQQERINTAMGYGGFPLLASTFERNFAIHVDHYIMTNFQGFINIVNTLGGIDVDASQNLTDRCDLSYALHSWCSVGPGVETLDGEKALWYVRSRNTSNDFDRTRRAQEVSLALFNKLMTFKAVYNAQNIYGEFINSTETDMTVADLAKIIKVAPFIVSDPGRINRFVIGTYQTTPYTFPNSGAFVLLPDYDAIWEIVVQAVYTP